LTRPRFIMVLSENWTIQSPRDLRGLVRLAQEAEAAGVDAVMVSEHIVLGPSAGAAGRPANPKAYAAPGNQDPSTPWPDSLTLLSAVAAVTTRLRLVAGAIIAPLRHPVLLAHQLATLDLLSEGRLVVQPTVSWHREEYDALGVPFDRRGRLLDEHLEAWRALWAGSPAAYRGNHYAFADVHLEPKPFRPDGPRLWFGGIEMSPFILRRLTTYGHGFHPFGQPDATALAELRAHLRDAGRDPSAMEFVGGLRARFPDATSPASLPEALEQLPAQLDAGYTSICFNPSQFTYDAASVPALCAELVERAATLTSS
jgi:probable F420-dependent oxidoreductase